MADNCIACETPVRPRQEAVQCDGCNKWQHRTCNTGISRADYRAAVHSGADLDWRCSQCSFAVPLTSTWLEGATDYQSLPISEPSASTIFDERTVPEPLSELLEELYTVYDPPAVNEEPSLADPPPRAVNAYQAPVTYEIESSNKGKRKLIDSNGYSYNVKRQRQNATDWQCIVRPKVNSLNDVSL